MKKTYSIIVADPPWDYGRMSQFNIHGAVSGARSHYKTMSLSDIVRSMKEVIEEFGDRCECLLFIWSSWPHLDQAITLGTELGFKYVHTPFIWNKMSTNPGYYTLTETEPVLCFKRGRIPQPRGSRNERQLVNEQRLRHSEKPQEVYSRIHRMFPKQKKLELFARSRRPHFDAWGDEI